MTMPDDRCHSVANPISCFFQTVQDRSVWAIVAVNSLLTPTVLSMLDGWTKVLVFITAVIGVGYAIRQWRLRGAETRLKDAELELKLLEIQRLKDELASN